jgi:hypothetical protein
MDGTVRQINPGRAAKKLADKKWRDGHGSPLHFIWFNLSFEVSKVSDGYWLSPAWLALPVLFSVTVSEGCGALFCG